MGITVELMDYKSLEELFIFEEDNREFFKMVGLARPVEYYRESSFFKLMQDYIMDSREDIAYMYLLRNEEKKIVGRINLFEIVRENLQSCEIGYRMDQQSQGRGNATKGVALVCREAFTTHGIHRLYAGCSPANIGSQIVLVKNGFQFSGRAKDYIKVGDRWEDSIFFEKINDY